MELITSEEVLHSRATETDTVSNNAEVRETILKMKEAVREKNLVGLTAPQVGVDMRIVVLNFDGDVRTFINPVVSNRKGIELSREVCEIDGKEYIVPRNNDIDIYYTTPLGKIEHRQLLGMAAKVMLHQLDILDGITASDFGLEVMEGFDEASDEDKDKIIKMYLDSLDLLGKQVEEELKNDEDAQQIKNAVNFITKVRKGEVQISDDRENGKVKKHGDEENS